MEQDFGYEGWWDAYSGIDGYEGCGGIEGWEGL